MLSILKKRRSVRKFKNVKIPQDIINDFKEALLRSPASKSSNPWEFIFVENSNTLETLSLSKPHGSSFLKYAKLGVVICADPEKSDVWIEDASIASIILQLTVENFELGSCWVQIRKRMHNNDKSSEEYVKDILNIPDNMRVLSIIGIGYPEDKKAGHKKSSLDFSKIYTEKYKS